MKGFQFIIRLLALSAVFFLSGCMANKNPGGDRVQFEVRALWVDPPGFVNRETVDKLIEKCSRAGINQIIANIMLRENVYFKSEHFAGNVRANDAYDPLAYLIEKAHAAGIKVQAWSCVYYSLAKKPEWAGKPFAFNQYDHVFLSPAHPEVNPYLLSVLKELLKYNIDGLHLDYTRYWNAAFDYSETARNRFSVSYGFDPADFLDHPEKIVPEKLDTYPVRVLLAKTMVDRVWELGAVERNLNHANTGYAFISEKPENIDALKAPGLLMISYYTNVSEEIGLALERYVKRGGSVVWIDPANGLFTRYPFLRAISGVSGTRNMNAGHISLQPVADKVLGSFFSPVRIKTSGNMPQPAEARVLARTEEGIPAITIHNTGSGSFIVMGSRLMDNDAPEVASLLQNMILTLRKQAGITGPDPLGEKRKQWIDWRASHVLELVRDVNKMVKQIKPDVKVTAAAGVGPQEHYGIYRNGATWLDENLVDNLFPMNYTENAGDLADVFKTQERFIPRGKKNRIYPGLQIYSKQEGKIVPMDAKIVDEQLGLVRRSGYKGFCLFAYSYFTDEIADIVRKHSN